MSFTAIHRALGRDPGPLTDELLDEAVQAGVTEAHDLDWKKQLPPEQNLQQTDFPKDVAAMANVGGGVIVFGVSEADKKADGRLDVGELSERHERTLRAAAVTAISPPVFGLEIVRLGTETRAVAVIVPASVDGPHLIYKGEYFGAPMRVDADTHWMRERELEDAYRTRFDDRRRATQELDALYRELLEARNIGEAPMPWMVCVARPRRPRPTRQRLTKEQAASFWTVAEATLTYAHRQFPRPTHHLDVHNPRAGLRRMVFRPAMPEQPWTETWAAFHDDGAVTLAGVVRDRPRPDAGQDQHPVELVRAVNIEAFVADIMALVKASAHHHDLDEFEVMVGIEWNSGKRLLLQTVDITDQDFTGTSVPLARYAKVPATVSTQASPANYHRAVHELALDAVNQGGIAHVRLINPPPMP
ncbi:RNA-binding domain-containing protein [Intrasporangium sp. YIM S08009]|uniref:RNA-binding domain-containing protein n=1 Tax=Intrasporangium zincisolvens TaxID=3080018 RepID=UPI002B05D316|nr:RNA-binding domain-containing protein [Intrasporangium sp. YIM S08009]